MMKHKSGKKRKALVVLILPAVAVLWMLGWTMFWTGSKPESKKSRRRFLHA